MKRLIFLFIILARTVAAQSEFPVYTNGLIYDEPTVKHLGAIVDSLNIRFRKCELAHPYQSFEQGRAVYVDVPSKAAQKLIDNGVSLSAYKQKIRKHNAKKCWLIKYRETDGPRSAIVYREVAGGYSAHQFDVERLPENDKKTGWVLSDDGKEAFWLESLTSSQLPEKYARMVQYVDCMVDTTADVFFPGIKENYDGKISDQVTEFITWARSFPGEPAMPDYTKGTNEAFYAACDVYRVRHRTWDSLRMLDLDANMKRSSYHSDLLAKATEEALKTKSFNPELELYVERYRSKKETLALKRSRHVIGRCSRDQGPRFHAINICMLSAETAQWDIFLRSHLDVMNDRFERMSDGSYAQGERKTYLKELEELDINAVDLLLGTCFRVANVSGRHYFGTISRIGRALTDAKDKDVIEAQLLEMVRDNQLDIFNRMVIVNTLRTYLTELDDVLRKSACEKELSDEIEKMPADLKNIVALSE